MRRDGRANWLIANRGNQGRRQLPKGHRESICPTLRSWRVVDDKGLGWTMIRLL